MIKSVVHLVTALFLFSVCIPAFANVRAVNSVDEETVDSLRFSALDAKLDEYCSALRYESVSVQKEECDFLIESCNDSLVRQYVAVSLYERFRTSKIMGVEAVAIHILDRWFFSSKVKFPNEIEFLDARIYADFNRQSLVGMKAQPLNLLDYEGHFHELFSAGSPQERFKILYFYDIHCSKCKVETIVLRNLLETNDYPIEFYPVYTGDDRDGWSSYVSERFAMNLQKSSVIHLFDPDNDSDFQQKYGVIQTPRLFLIAPDNTIIGRSLDAMSLDLMLSSFFKEKTLEYGSTSSVAALDSVLGDEEITSEDIRYFADHLASTALPKGDTLSFRQMSGDLLYYLSSKPTEASREGLSYLIDNYILNRHDIWKSTDDSVKVIGMASMMNELLSKAKPGTEIANLKIPGELRGWKRSVKGEWKLGRLRGKTNVIIFYTDGCANCEAQKKAVDNLFAMDHSDLRRELGTIKVLTINMDEILSDDARLAGELFDAFDLSSLPYIVITDKRGYILRRYVSLL